MNNTLKINDKTYNYMPHEVCKAIHNLGVYYECKDGAKFEDEISKETININ